MFNDINLLFYEDVIYYIIFICHYLYTCQQTNVSMIIEISLCCVKVYCAVFRRYISNEKSDDLLHELVINIGYFTVMNEENQVCVYQLFLQILNLQILVKFFENTISTSQDISSARKEDYPDQINTQQFKQRCYKICKGNHELMN